MSAPAVATSGAAAEANQKGTNVQVAVRCRPMNAEERKNNAPIVINCEPENKAIKVNYGPAGKKVLKTFTFDRVFGTYSTQEEVFETMVRPIIEETLSGFNCTIFAYGQTGTGKTHTMEGNINAEEEWGIVPRSAKTIIEELEASGVEFTIRVSFLELYNEELQDLLADTAEGKGPLRLCDDSKKGGGVVCQNLEEVTVLNARDIYDILQRGIKRRQTAETLMNKNSSRSHSIFTIKIMIKETNVEGEDVVRHGQLNLVDLAGSECVGRSGAKNDRAREAGSINQSLLTLGRVITALVDHHGHIPYRDSKLTRILQESLGGRAKTCIIATLSPSQMAVDESVSTLDYAYRAKNIKNRPEVNQKMTKKVLLKEYGAEIENLRLMLQMTREKNGVYVAPAQFDAMEQKISAQEAQITECESALRSRTEELKQLKSEREMIDEQIRVAQLEIETKTSELEKVTMDLQQTAEDLTKTKVELQASDAVIEEQVDTESSLFKEGTYLQSTVSTHRGDISALFDKVDRHVSMEQRRVTEADAFRSGVAKLQDSMIVDIDAMKGVNIKHTEELCSGVATLLDKGRDTCNSLQTAIDGALGVLVADAGASRDTMTASCAALESSLTTMRNEATASLAELKDKLVSWIGQAETEMTRVIDHMQLQKQEIESLHAQVIEANENQVQDRLKFNNKYHAMTEESNKHVNSQIAKASGAIGSFKQQQKSLSGAQIAFATSKTQELQSMFNSMLENMRTSMASMISESTQHCEFFCESMETENHDLQNVIVRDNTSKTAFVSEAVESFNQQSESIKNSTLSSLKTIEDSRFESLSSMDGLRASVPAKQTLLVETEGAVKKQIETAISEGCESVRETANIANTTLTNIVNATESMNASTRSSIDSFNHFMDNAGDALRGQLSEHFQGLDVFLQSQDQAARNTIEEADKFKEQSDVAVVMKTGATPVKKAFTPLRSLRSTRDHEDIKNEVRCGKRRLVEEDIVLSVDGESESCNAVEPSPRSTSSASSASSSSSKVTLEMDSENADPQQTVEMDASVTVTKAESIPGPRKGSSIAKAPVKRTRTEKTSLSERA